MFDDLTPLRRAYGVEAPAERRPAPGADGSVAEEALLRQSRAALEATVGAQDRQPALAVLEAVRAEAARASAEALAPLAAVRSLYGELTAASPNPAEAALLAQTRAAVEQTVDARVQSPSDDTVAAVLAFAATQTRLAPRPDAAAEAPVLAPLAVAYGLPLGAETAPDSAETALLVQTRALLDAAPQAVVSEASVASVLAAAASATRLAARPDAAVGSPQLAPLAVAYGLPLGTEATLDPVETVLLVQTRAVLDAAPATAGPSEAVLSAVLAHAAEAAASARPDAPRPADRPAADRPALASDREPVRAARSYRRVGAWASAAMAMAAVVFVLLPRTAGAPEPTGADSAQVASAAALVPSAPGVAEGDLAEARPATPDPEPAAADLLAPVAEPVAAPSAPVASGPSSSEPAPRAAAPRASVEVSPSVEALRSAPARPTAAPSAPSARSVADVAETTALASADVTPPNDDAWDVQDDVRVLSLRLQELRRGNEGLAWDTPTEAFGAPTTRSAVSAPAIRSVRTTVPAARARLVTPVTGDR